MFCVPSFVSGLVLQGWLNLERHCVQIFFKLLLTVENIQWTKRFKKLLKTLTAKR